MTRKNESHKPCRRAIKLTVSYRLNIAASVTFTLAVATPGRIVGGRCDKQTAGNQRHARCTCVTPVSGSITIQVMLGRTRSYSPARLAGARLVPAAIS